MGFSGKKISTVSPPITGTIPASGSLDADTIPKSDFDAAKWLVRLSSTTKHRSFSVNGLLLDTDIRRTLTEKFGDSINVAVSVVDTGANVVLRFINSETFPVDVSAVKFEY